MRNKLSKQTNDRGLRHNLLDEDKLLSV